MQAWKDILWLLSLVPLTFIGCWLLNLAFKGFAVVCFMLLTPSQFWLWMKEEVLWPINKR